MSGMDTDYRLVRAGDSAALLDFMRAVSGDTDNLALSAADFGGIDERDEQFFIAEVKSSSSVLALAISDGKIIGSCEIRVARRLRTKHRGELAIAVRKEYWGKGIASHLLDFASEEAVDRGVTKLIVSTRIDNDRAKAFFLRHGFFDEGTDSKLLYIDGHYVDGIRLGKDIG